MAGQQPGIRLHRRHTPLDDHNVRRQFRKITEIAGLGSAGVPRELRHIRVAAVRSRRPGREDRVAVWARLRRRPYTETNWTWAV